jgi:hypothetical protein
MTTFGAAGSQYTTAVFRCHAGAETMLVSTTTSARLIRTLHTFTLKFDSVDFQAHLRKGHKDTKRPVSNDTLGRIICGKSVVTVDISSLAQCLLYGWGKESFTEKKSFYGVF